MTYLIHKIHKNKYRKLEDRTHVPNKQNQDETLETNK